MKSVILAIVLLSSSAFARPFVCKGEDEHTGAVKAVITGDVLEKEKYGMTFLVGDFTFKIKEPNKPFYENTMKVAISENNKVNIISKNPELKDGGSVFDLGHFAMGGRFFFWNLDGTAAYKIEVTCKGLYK